MGNKKLKDKKVLVNNKKNRVNTTSKEVQT